MNTNIRVMMCDLTHFNKVSASDNIPLGIGMLSAYAQKCLGTEYEFELFKEPQSIDKDFEDFNPHIVGLTNYCWNTRVSSEFAKYVKKLHPEIVTIFGGPNYPVDLVEKEKFLNAHPEIDFYLPLDAEISFKDILKLLRENNFNSELVKESGPIDGVDFIYQGKFISGKPLPRLQVTEIPSPYLLGMFDKFLNPKWEPLVITSRGCPFKCTFCVEGQDYYSKVHFRDLEEIEEELIYIAKKLQGSGARLTFADSNFGMYADNIKIAQIVKQCRETYGWPHSVAFTAGKNRKERVLEAVKILGKNTSMASDIQSSDADVLEAIGRTNVSLDTLVETTQALDALEIGSFSCVILALPQDSKSRFLQSVKHLMESNIQKIVVFTLMILDGAKLSSIEDLNKFEYAMSYRVFPRSFGKYTWGGVERPITEVDQVAIGNPTLSKKDYLFCRAFSLSVTLFYNDRILSSLHNFLKSQGVETFDYIFYLHSNLESAPEDLRDFYEELSKDIEAELFDTPESLIKNYEENVDDYLSEKLGFNIFHKTMTQGWLFHLKSIVNFAFEQAQNLLIKKNGELSPLQNKFLDEMQQYIMMRCENFMDPNQILEHSFNFRPDQLRTGEMIEEQQKNRASHKVLFTHNKSQIEFINARLKEANGSAGMGRVLSSQTNVTTMFRRVKEVA
jgi:radical SAM superfamily enzyme YgiQ (UPF0313 family)